jgi:hypothetical protein
MTILALCGGSKYGEGGIPHCVRNDGSVWAENGEELAGNQLFADKFVLKN